MTTTRAFLSEMSHFKVFKEIPTLKFFLKDFSVKPPRKAHGKAAGFDLFFSKDHELQKGLTKVPMGFGIELPEGHMGLMKIRSSAAIRGLSLEAGVIDESFDPASEVFAIINNHTDSSITVPKGEAAIQLLLLPVPEVQLSIQGPKEPQENKSTGNKHTGLGSTGNVISNPSVMTETAN